MKNNESFCFNKSFILFFIIIILLISTFFISQSLNKKKLAVNSQASEVKVQQICKEGTARLICKDNEIARTTIKKENLTYKCCDKPHVFLKMGMWRDDKCNKEFEGWWGAEGEDYSFKDGMIKFGNEETALKKCVDSPFIFARDKKGVLAEQIRTMGSGVEKGFVIHKSNICLKPTQSNDITSYFAAECWIEVPFDCLSLECPNQPRY